ncbi:DNA repair protein RadA [Helicobacter bilis]|nr:DNA repair protein RadA [Helicobacter bilis]
MQNLDSKNYTLNPATHPDLTQNLESNQITQKAPHQPIKTEYLNSKTTQKTGRKVLYVSGEESLSQIHNRAKRCHCLSDNLYLLSEINILEIKENLLNGGFEVCIIDSIQTIYSPNLTAAPGSVSQVREITFELMRLAKSFNIAMFIIGHITKDGQIAGPRVLEHMVDCVLYFEGERSNELKILRGFKNRFGTTSEIGIFEMKAHGLVSANEATKKFFNAKKDMSGSAAVAIMEGSRCIVVEIQALTCENEYGVPKRLTNGFDSNRLNMILALLEKKLGIHLHKHDVFVNVAGGIKISETSADLALIASILSSYKNRPLRSSTAFIGEVSLIGDIREVGGLELRLKELANFGFKNAIVPNIPKGYKGQVKCTQALEVAQIIEWM